MTKLYRLTIEYSDNSVIPFKGMVTREFRNIPFKAVVALMKSTVEKHGPLSLFRVSLEPFD